MFSCNFFPNYSSLAVRLDDLIFPAKTSYDLQSFSLQKLLWKYEIYKVTKMYQN